MKITDRFAVGDNVEWITLGPGPDYEIKSHQGVIQSITGSVATVAIADSEDDIEVSLFELKIIQPA